MLRKTMFLGARLKRRWRDQDSRLDDIVKALKEDRDWTVYLVDGPGPDHRRLALGESSRLPALEGEAGPRDLRGATLRNLDLDGTTRLADAFLDHCVFDGVSLKEASLRGSSLRHAQMINQTNLDGAQLSFCDLTGANLRDTWLPSADLSNSDLTGTDFTGATLTGACLRDVTFTEEGPFGKIFKGRHWTCFGGDQQKAEKLDPSSDQDIIQYARDQVGQFRLRSRHPSLARVAYLLTNFGASPGRLCCWVLALWLIFALLYCSQCAKSVLPQGTLRKVVEWFAPEIVDSVTREPVKDPRRLIYYSAVTLTTVGFGDIVPGARDWRGQAYVCLEAFSGYVLLGAFSSLLLRGVLSSRE